MEWTVVSYLERLHSLFSIASNFPRYIFLITDIDDSLQAVSEQVNHVREILINSFKDLVAVKKLL